MYEISYEVLYKLKVFGTEWIRYVRKMARKSKHRRRRSLTILGTQKRNFRNNIVHKYKKRSCSPSPVTLENRSAS